MLRTPALNIIHQNRLFTGTDQAVATALYKPNDITALADSTSFFLLFHQITLIFFCILLSLILLSMPFIRTSSVGGRYMGFVALSRS